MILDNHYDIMALKKYKNSPKLWKKIRELREEKNISQERMATLLDVNRVVRANIESWKRNIKSNELELIAEIFEKPMSYFVSEKDEIKTLNKKDKHYIFKKVFLYIINKLWDKANFWKVVAYKLLYFSEFNHYEKFGESIFNIEFIKRPMGPVPEPHTFKKILEEMKRDNQIEEIKTIFQKYEQHRFISKLKDIDFYSLLEDLKPGQTQVIDDVIERLWNMNATQISEYSHHDMPYKATEKIWNKIDKDLVFYRSSVYSVTS